MNIHAQQQARFWWHVMQLPELAGRARLAMVEKLQAADEVKVQFTRTPNSPLNVHALVACDVVVKLVTEICEKLSAGGTPPLKHKLVTDEIAKVTAAPSEVETILRERVLWAQKQTPDISVLEDVSELVAKTRYVYRKYAAWYLTDKLSKPKYRKRPCPLCNRRRVGVQLDEGREPELKCTACGWCEIPDWGGIVELLQSS